MTGIKITDLRRNTFGRIVMTQSDGSMYEDVYFVCAFPLSAPSEQIAILNKEGKEVGWIDSLSELSDKLQDIVHEALRNTKFITEIYKILDVSSMQVPCVWDVETSRGVTQFVLLKEEDIQMTSFGLILINDSRGMSFIIRDINKLDKKSKHHLGHFCVAP